MPQKLLKTTKTTFSENQLTKYVNRQNGTTFSRIGKAILAIGLTAVGYAIINPIAGAISAGAGIAMGLDEICDALEDAKLTKYVEAMGDNDSLEVTTKFYEYTSNSQGNIVHYCTVSYKIV